MCVNRYWSDLACTAVVGSPKSELQRVLTIVREAQEAAVAAVRPGLSADEIDATARYIIARQGFSAYFTHGSGHHVGFRYHDSGFAIAPGQSWKLEPSMVVTV